MIGHHWMRRGLAILVAGGLAASLAAGAGAAAPNAKGERPGKAAHKQKQARLAGALERLNLSSEQQERIRAIRMRQRAELQALKGGGDKAAMKGHLKDLKTKYRAEIMAVLTPDQRRQLKAEMKKARAARKNVSKAL